MPRKSVTHNKNLSGANVDGASLYTKDMADVADTNFHIYKIEISEQTFDKNGFPYYNNHVV